MKPLNETVKLPDDIFKRTAGLSKDDFYFLQQRLIDCIAKDKEKWPMKKRGIKGELSVGDQLLLSLYYLRQYATLQVIGQVFGISESYCHKVYYKITGYLMKILRMPNRKSLMGDTLESVAIDVTEQPIERPGHNQKDFYSGKKTSHDQSAANYMLDNIGNSSSLL